MVYVGSRRAVAGHRRVGPRSGHGSTDGVPPSASSSCRTDQRARALLHRAYPRSHNDDRPRPDTPTGGRVRRLADSELAFLVRLPGGGERGRRLPTKFGEYVAPAACRVVTTDIGWDIADIVRHTGSGLLVDPFGDPGATAEDILRFRARVAADPPATRTACRLAADEMSRGRWLASLSAELVSVLGTPTCDTARGTLSEPGTKSREHVAWLRSTPVANRWLGPWRWPAHRVVGALVREQRAEAGTDFEHLDTAMLWLRDAQAAVPGGVSARYDLARGWQPAYPETSGYIIGTLLHHADVTGRPGGVARARAIGDWLLGIQDPTGFVAGDSWARTARRAAGSRCSTPGRSSSAWSPWRSTPATSATPTARAGPAPGSSASRIRAVRGSGRRSTGYRAYSGPRRVGRRRAAVVLDGPARGGGPPLGHLGGRAARTTTVGSST